MRPYDYLIVGAGFAGSVMAERLATHGRKRVLLIDRREHIGGNAHDAHDRAGILVHRYGPHIFHTNSFEVFTYLSRFTKWRPYQHRVLACVRGQLLPIPINLDTVNRLYDLSLSEDGVRKFLEERAEPVSTITTSEDAVVARVGRELYELFFRHYTRKQWGLDPSELDASVTARIPVRYDRNDRYFQDRYQAMPADGYTALFDHMLDHPNITVRLGIDFKELKPEQLADSVVYSGPVDEYFDYQFGRLPYRSLRFQHETLELHHFQTVGVVNYPSADVPYTRITEYKYLTGQRHPCTSVSYEYASDDGEPYYPVPRPANAALYGRYRELADELPNVFFIGRLGTYRYYNMDQVVAQALATYARIVGASTWTEVA
jgi:UDP-galactopyranose mutase